MILRRLTEHVKDQNWFAVTLDFVIVVLGVFMGIQLGNWNTARSNERLGEQYVARLEADLRTDLKGARNMTNYYAEVAEAVLETDRLLLSDDPDPRALVINAYRATEIAQWPQSHATWDQIVSAGHLGLLPDGPIMEALNLYFVYDQAEATYQVVEKSEYRRVVRSIIPVSVQQEIRAGCSDLLDEFGAAIGFVEPCVVDIAPDVFAETAERLKSDPRVHEALRYQFSEVTTAYNNLYGNTGYIETALAAIAGEETIE